MSEPPSAGKDQGERRRMQVISHVLRIVDRQIGRGEEPSFREWSEIREMALKYAGGAKAVAALETVVRNCAEQVSAKIRAGEPDAARFRAGVVHLIRALVRKQFGPTDAGSAHQGLAPLRSRPRKG